MKNFNFKIKYKKNKNGFILPFAILISTLILSVSLGVSTILVKEIFFSNLNRESFVAYYAADVAMECALSLDDNFVGAFGSGIFPYDEFNDATSTFTYINTTRNTNFSSTTVYCASVPVFDSSISSLESTLCEDDTFCENEPSPSGYFGMNTNFDMRMDLGGGEYRCASVTVTKTPNGDRRIISRGYNSCNPGNQTLIERAIINISETN